jgi:hypothetical protein
MQPPPPACAVRALETNRKRVAQLKCRGGRGWPPPLIPSLPPLGARHASALNRSKRGVAQRSIRLQSVRDHPCVEVRCNQAWQARSSSLTPPRAPAALVMRRTRTPKEARRNPKNQSPKAAAVRTACVSCATEYCRSQNSPALKRRRSATAASVSRAPCCPCRRASPRRAPRDYAKNQQIQVWLQRSCVCVRGCVVVNDRLTAGRRRWLQRQRHG